MDSPTALHLISLLDLTSLNATDTPEEILALCERASHPLSGLNKEEFEAAVESKYGVSIAIDEVHTAAVCVYPVLVETAAHTLSQKPGKKIHLASVAGGFPSGMTPLSTRLQEIELAVEAGADEIDTVLNRSLLLQGLDDKVVEEISLMKKASGDAHLKVILETGELKTPELIEKASRLAIGGGADVIKTSTGKVMPAATLEAFEVMMNVIAEEYLATKKVIGIKPAGGIRTTADALSYTVKCQDILRERVSTEFAEAYLKADTFRIGASSLLDDLVASIAEDLSLSVQKSELI